MTWTGFRQRLQKAHQLECTKQCDRGAFSTYPATKVIEILQIMKDVAKFNPQGLARMTEHCKNAQAHCFFHKTAQTFAWAFRPLSAGLNHIEAADSNLTTKCTKTVSFGKKEGFVRFWKRHLGRYH